MEKSQKIQRTLLMRLIEHAPRVRCNVCNVMWGFIARRGAQYSIPDGHGGGCDKAPLCRQELIPESSRIDWALHMWQKETFGPSRRSGFFDDPEIPVLVSPIELHAQGNDSNANS